MTGWQAFIDNVKWNYPLPLLVFGLVMVVYAAQRLRGEIDNLMLRARIRDHMPEIQKQEIQHYEAIIEEKDERIAWLESEVMSHRRAARGAMGYLSGLVTTENITDTRIRRPK